MIQRQTPPDISITEDHMKAFLMLYPVEEGEPDYTVKELKDYLAGYSVVYGVDDRVIAAMIAEKNYMERVCVAKGRPMKEGKDGYFVYHFNKSPNRKPVEKEDGTVDYWGINLIETVVRGQAIVEYHPAVQGQTGYTVKGVASTPSKVKEMPPLKGRGFERSEDNTTYIATLDGKIEQQGDHIVINPIYEVYGNADMKVGNINFPGAVIIHGNVCTGTTIKAAESITVDGTIESAHVESGKDIIVRNGVKGAGNAKVIAKGNISAKYIEFAEVEAEGDIHADAIINSEVYCREKVVLTGKHGMITGGRITAVRGVDAKEIGNNAENQTMIHVGAQPDVLRQAEALKRQVRELEGNLKRIEQGIENFDKLAETKQEISKDDPRRMQLVKIKIRDTARLAAEKAKLSNLEKIIEESEGAKVLVLSKVNAGTEIGIDNIRVVLRDYYEHVEFVKRLNKIAMNSLVAAPSRED